MRRRTQQVRGYREGGGVVMDDADIPDAAPAAVSEQSQPPEYAAPEEPDLTPEQREEQIRSEHAVLDALDAQRRAEQHAAEMEKMPPVERQLAEANPWMMPEERGFILKNGAVLFAPENRPIAESAWNEAADSGIERGTQSFFNFVLKKVARGREVAEAADRLDRDVDRTRLTIAAGEPAPIPEAPEVDSFNARVKSGAAHAAGGAIPPQRRSMPMAAPVSRGNVSAYSGKPRVNDMNLNSLTAEERMIARDSIPDRPDAPKMTDTQKEYEYLRNKKRYAAMRASGEYTDQRSK